MIDEDFVEIKKLKKSLIKRNNIRSYTKFAVADEVELELEKKVEEMIARAEGRAKANNRRTILARDL